MFCSNAIDTVKMKLLCFEGGKPTNKTCTILFSNAILL